MKKTRMSIDDIHAMVGSIRKNVLSMRVTNIYDLAATGDAAKTNKTYILKLHQPPFPKIFLLLESGVRFHTSKYARDASSGSSLPSQFTMKLRKHLRGKRLVALTQLEGDRVVDFTFGADQLQCHLILELYASGNIILTDENYTILSLLRTHKFDENVKMAVRQVYPVSVLGESATKAVADAAELIQVVDHWFTEHDMRALEAKATGAGTAKKPKPQTLKQLLLTKESSFGGLGPVIVEHCIVSAGLVANQKIKNASEFKAIGVTELARLVEELQKGWTVLEKLQSEQVTVVTAEETEGKQEEKDDEPTPKRGFIVLKPKASENDMDQFEEFTPFLYAQHHGKPIKEFTTFDEAVDEYFSHFEAQHAEAARQSAKAAAENKLEKLRRSQRQQLDQLVEVQEMSLRHAQLVESNQQDVEHVLLVVRSALASGMDWRGLAELVRFEQRNGNPVACLIHELDLAHNRVAILLCDNDEDEDGDEARDEGEEDRAAHVIWIDLSLSALANAREIYAKKKKTVQKVQKATEATDRAIELAERNTKKTLEKQQTKRATIYQRRKTLWFEKFHWFISSENYLVIGGKDAQQNELLVKRYLRKGDIYVHADLHGAATCVVRNRAGDGGDKAAPIPVATLEQAGWMSVCRSHAWASQVIAGAYWVHADQVSKAAPSGEYLATGSFMVRGKKNYVNPSRLELGLGIVFRVDEASRGERQVEDEDEGGERKVERVEEEEEELKDNVKEQDDEEEEEEVEVEVEGGEDGETEDKEDEVVEEEDVADTVEGEETKEEEENDAQKDEMTPAEEGTRKEEEEEEAEQEDTEAQAHSKGDSGKKRLSAKQRRDLKKGKPLAEVLASEPPPPPPKQQASDSKKRGGKAADKATPEPPVKGNVRGKKGKLKKLKKKYADQDDDDRRLRLEALGHVVPSGENEEDPQEEDDPEAENAEEHPETGASTKPDHSDEFIRQQREKKDRFLDEQEEEAEAADFFDAFTGSPRPHDLLLFALPMCAPYAALAKHKYKVKLVPGSTKKGKAAKTAMDYFLASTLREEKDLQKNATLLPSTQTQKTESAESNAVREALDIEHVVVQRELMRCITDNELVACLVGPVKIIAPGISGTAAKSGGGKKAGGGGGKKKGKK
jgi:predicted ribosome quality control (RQC) complex YloA/Tae2 family protein